MNKHDQLFFTNIERMINIFAILSLLLLSVVVFVYQIILNQPPCPLCLLQRFGFLSIAFGALLNLRFGLRSSHYAIILLSALFTSFVSLRQMALSFDIGKTSSLLFGFHLATWAFIVSLIIVIVTAILLGSRRATQELHSDHSYWKSITTSLFAMLAIILFANMVSVFLQCGLLPCAENPIGYKLLNTPLAE
jgi:disulfide bond formation protein DsbB